MVNGCVAHSSRRLLTLHPKICQLFALTTKTLSISMFLLISMTHLCQHSYDEVSDPSPTSCYSGNALGTKRVTPSMITSKISLATCSSDIVIASSWLQCAAPPKIVQLMTRAIVSIGTCQRVSALCPCFSHVKRISAKVSCVARSINGSMNSAGSHWRYWSSKYSKTTRMSRCNVPLSQKGTEGSSLTKSC